jgi:hypothetical protein
VTKFLSFASTLYLGSAALLAASCADEQASVLDDTQDTGSDEGSSADAGADTTPDTATDVPANDVDVVEEVPVEFTVSDEDFECLTDWEPVRGFFLTNLLGDTANAVRIAEGGFEEAAPVGTVIQLVPQEAMVKLSPGTSPDTNDWEYFVLQNNLRGTSIIERGFEAVANVAGTCNSCHSGASTRDFVCEDTGLCAAAALPRELIDLAVDNDPRCD